MTRLDTYQVPVSSETRRYMNAVLSHPSFVKWRTEALQEPWTIENGLLTPTMKLKRAKLEAAVADKLEGWYSANKPVLWA